MSLKRILKMMEKKYPAGTGENEAGWLGAMLMLYDDGGGFIRRTSTDNDYMTDHLFDFSTVDELIQHLQEK